MYHQYADMLGWKARKNGNNPKLDLLYLDKCIVNNLLTGFTNSSDPLLFLMSQAYLGRGHGFHPFTSSNIV